MSGFLEGKASQAINNNAPIRERWAEIQQLAQQLPMWSHPLVGREVALTYAAQQLGIPVPENYHITPSGALEENSPWWHDALTVGSAGLMGIGAASALGGGAASNAALSAQAGGEAGTATTGTFGAGTGAGGAGATGAAGAAGSAATVGKSLGSLKDLIPLIAAGGIGGLGRLMNSGSGDPAQASLPPELQQLFQMSMQRMASQQPLFEAVNTQALAGLPNYAKGKS